MTKSGGGGQFALASPRSKFWGDLSPLSHVIYAHACNLTSRISHRYTYYGIFLSFPSALFSHIIIIIIIKSERHVNIIV